MTLRQQVEQRTPDLIRALGGADAICKAGCTCRGSYTGPERRKAHREPDPTPEQVMAEARAYAADLTAAYYPAEEVVLTLDSPSLPCSAEGCDLFGPHDLHRDSEGFQWRQVTA
jgi:hypothetical protein